MDSIRDEMKDLKRQVEEEAAEVRTYVVKSGDSLSTIAEELLGDAGRWQEIFEANEDKIDDPNQIKAGQELRIPS
jgi:nucleoid-associated protein YgaU